MNHAPGWRTVVALLAGLLVVSSPAFGQGIINPFGQPQIVIRTQPSYYVWVDQTGWHVRWSTPFPQAFSGFITSNGQISGVCAAGGVCHNHEVRINRDVQLPGEHGPDTGVAGLHRPQRRKLACAIVHPVSGSFASSAALQGAAPERR